MKELRRLSWLCLLLTVVGCASDDSGDRSVSNGGSGGGHQGGQTGSLVPCTDPLPLQPGGSIPSDDKLFVLPTACGEEPVASFELTDLDGNVIPVERELIDSGNTLIRSTEPLAPGQYQVRIPGEDMPRELVVTDEVAAPTSLGSVTTLVEGGCQTSLLIELSPEAAAHVATLGLDVSASNTEFEPLIAPGDLQVQDGIAVVAVPACVADDCARFPSLTLRAHLAGEEPFESQMVTLDWSCSSSSPPLEAGCSLAGGPPSQALPSARTAGFGAFPLGLALLVVGAERRRHRLRSDRR